MKFNVARGGDDIGTGEIRPNGNIPRTGKEGITLQKQRVQGVQEVVESRTLIDCYYGNDNRVMKVQLNPLLN